MGLGKQRAFGALSAIAVALLPALVQPVSAGAAGTGTLFGNTGLGWTTVSKIDPLAGTVTPLVTVGSQPDNSQVTSLTGDPATHRIFGVRESVTIIPPGFISVTIVIVTINSQTGAISVSPRVNGAINSIQFDTVTNTLYALDPSGPQRVNKLVKVDPGTGVVSPVANIGPTGVSIDQMAIAPQAHKVYVSRENVGDPIAGFTTKILTVDTLTGAVSTSPVLSRAIRTITYDTSSTKLFGATECCPRDLVQIDPVSGTQTFVTNIHTANDQIFSTNMATDPSSHTVFTILDTLRGFGLFDSHVVSINTLTGVSTLGPALPVGTRALYFEGTATPPDTSPPTTSIALAPTPNGAGWNRTDVTVKLSATDPDGVADVATIQYSAAGAQPIASTVVGGSTASFTLNAEGVTTVTYFAKDKAGNTEVAHTQAIRIDKTPPTVTYAGNAGTYTVDQTVAITCTAVDPPNANGTAGSGLASTTCANVNAPAYSFPLGPNTLSASAIDVAGNTGSGSTTFSVEVTYTSLCMLTVQFIESSAAFQAVPAAARAHGDRLCKLLTRADFAADPEKKAKILEGYQKALPHMVKLTFLTPDHAAILLALSQAL